MIWLTALNFIRSPIGKYLLIALACIALIFGFATHERHVQYAKDQIHERKAVASVQASLDTCHLNTAALEGTLSRQNAAVDALKSDSDRRAKMLSDGLTEARKGRAGAEARAAGLLSHPAAGVDACARAEAAREAVLGSLQP